MWVHGVTLSAVGVIFFCTHAGVDAPVSAIEACMSCTQYC